MKRCIDIKLEVIARKSTERIILLIFLTLICFLYVPEVKAQFCCGISGALNSPTAFLPEDGTFVLGGNYLPSQMMPVELKYNSGNYFLNVTFFSFMELSYRSTFIRCKSGNPLKHKYTWNKDRSVAIKFRLFPENKTWRPALAIGSNDVVTTNNILHLTSDLKGNRYFASVYGVMTKTISINRQRLKLSAGYYVPFYDHSYYKGFFGSAAWIPGRLNWFSVWGEYDSNAVNLGIRACIFNHFEVQVFCYDFKAVSGGIRYSLNLLGRRSKCDR